MKHAQTLKSLARTLLLTVFSPKKARAKRRLLSLTIFMFFALNASLSQAQYYRANQEYIFDVQISTGITPFLGDLGGSFSKGNKTFKDIDLASLGTCAGAGFGFKLSPKWALRASYMNATVRGSDKWSENLSRKDRNLSFKSPINEVYLLVEYTMAKVRLGKVVLEPRVFGGVGYFQFNPKAEYNGQWVELQPLGTEGQGIKEGVEKYKRTSTSIPFGMALHARVTDRSSIGVMMNFHKSFTDYIDDVSGVYFDNDAIRNQHGEMAANLADRNTYNTGDQKMQNGAQRGNPSNNDNFAFVSLVYSYSFGNAKSANRISNVHLRKCINTF